MNHGRSERPSPATSVRFGQSASAPAVYDGLRQIVTTTLRGGWPRHAPTIIRFTIDTACGIPLGTPAKRGDRFKDAREVLTGLMSQEATTFWGK